MSVANDRQEVRLFGTSYPIIGPVQRSIITPFPGKVTEGQTTRDDEVVTSSWIQSDWSGGVGIINADLPQHQDRFYDSRLETRYPNSLSLLQYMEPIDADIGPAEFMIDYDNTLHVFVENEVYAWDETTQAFTNIKTLTNAPTDMAIYKGDLYIACGDAAASNNLQTYDGTTWGTVDEDFTHLCVWDDRLFGIVKDGTISWSTNGSTFTAVGKLDKPDNWVQQLLIFFDREQLPIVHAVTRDGLYAHDYTDEKFHKTPMTWPSHPRVGTATVWRSELYIPVGDIVYKWNNQTVQVLGPNKDEGVPSALQGDITAVTPAHPFYFITIAATETDGVEFDPLYPASPNNTSTFPEFPRRAVVMASAGTSFHPIYVEGVEGGSIGAVGVSDVQGVYRLWISTSSGMYSTKLTTGVHNPLQSPVSRYEEEGYLVTPWFDNDWPEIDKLALSVRTTSEHVSGIDGTTIRIYAQFEDDASDWEQVGTCLCQASQGRTAGRDVFTIDQAKGGRVFRRVRFRIEMERGSDKEKTPILRSLSISFMLRPTTLYGYSITLDLNKPNHDGQTPRQLNHLITEAASQKQAGFFVYNDEHTGESFETMVVVSRLVVSEQTGRDHRSRVQVGLVQPQGED